MNNLFKGLVILNTIIVAAIIVVMFVQKKGHIVYVDSNKLLNEYKGMQVARDAYQKKAVVWKANVDTLTNEVKKQIMDYEKASGGMTVKERQLSQELIRTRQTQLAQYQQAMNSQAQQEDSKMTSEVLSQINGYIKKYGESHDYKIIMAATDYGNLAYADEGLDITKEILEGLNNEYKGL